MKPLSFFISLFIFISMQSRAQVTNTRQGQWSDNTLWSNNAVPTANDDVVLYFDISIIGNAYCRSLNANGHNVTVSTGSNLTITGTSTSGDTLLSRFVLIDTTGPVTDTFETIDFYYDDLKRNVSVIKRQYENGLSLESVITFSYENNNLLPNYLSGYSYRYFNGDSSFDSYEAWLRFQGEQLIEDSGSYGVQHYTYLPNAVIKQFTDSNGSTYDTTYVTYDTRGNITLQTHSPTQDSFVYVYDNHPNPFYYVNRNKGNVLYQIETFPQEVMARNNMLFVDQYDYNGQYINGQLYRYNGQGYPVEIWGYDPRNPSQVGDGKGLYFYTH